MNDMNITHYSSIGIAAPAAIKEFNPLKEFDLSKFRQIAYAKLPNDTASYTVWASIFELSALGMAVALLDPDNKVLAYAKFHATQWLEPAEMLPCLELHILEGEQFVPQPEHWGANYLRVGAAMLADTAPVGLFIRLGTAELGQAEYLTPEEDDGQHALFATAADVFNPRFARDLHAGYVKFGVPEQHEKIATEKHVHPETVQKAIAGDEESIVIWEMKTGRNVNTLEQLPESEQSGIDAFEEFLKSLAL